MAAQDFIIAYYIRISQIALTIIDLKLLIYPSSDPPLAGFGRSSFVPRHKISTPHRQ